ncbi:hypothetical protein T484DRAFT_3519442 [Baffinella frigidus]|nr:hypothetical protein T484DRAFT_3519442 [Cryptophyta sp. CCMP2293]
MAILAVPELLATCARSGRVPRFSPAETPRRKDERGAGAENAEVAVVPSAIRRAQLVKRLCMSECFRQENPPSSPRPPRPSEKLTFATATFCFCHAGRVLVSPPVPRSSRKGALQPEVGSTGLVSFSSSPAARQRNRPVLWAESCFESKPISVTFSQGSLLTLTRKAKGGGKPWTQGLVGVPTRNLVRFLEPLAAEKAGQRPKRSP